MTSLPVEDASPFEPTGSGADAGLPPGNSDPAPAAPEPKPAGDGEVVEEEDGLEGRPDTPVPELGVLLEALQWAFQGEEIDPALLPRFAEHARLVLQTNREVNLTAIVDPREIAAKHYLDSWRVTRLMPLYGKRLFDLGSGAGFPGVPVAIAEPEAKVTLCDSVQKRATFLERCVKDLALKNARPCASARRTTSRATRSTWRSCARSAPCARTCARCARCGTR
ncbi:MAG: class I SAM-dependent methyltransferase [Planctomycetes bacterium]|nr:class I SAM-dependent methyltransferase [Planctomycetota bacterium]